MLEELLELFYGTLDDVKLGTDFLHVDLEILNALRILVDGYPLILVHVICD